MDRLGWGPQFFADMLCFLSRRSLRSELPGKSCFSRHIAGTGALAIHPTVRSRVLRSQLTIACVYFVVAIGVSQFRGQAKGGSQFFAGPSAVFALEAFSGTR